ncbi:hypothetical protein [Rhizorhabdus argentea]|uniref:hypothetical protein n=1 Tax=Rhizorhabdus argentea TaxID=1387174 RepID=UPI0030ED145E
MSTDAQDSAAAAMQSANEANRRAAIAQQDTADANASSRDANARAAVAQQNSADASVREANLRTAIAQQATIDANARTEALRNAPPIAPVPMTTSVKIVQRDGPDLHDADPSIDQARDHPAHQGAAREECDDDGDHHPLLKLASARRRRPGSLLRRSLIRDGRR